MALDERKARRRFRKEKAAPVKHESSHDVALVFDEASNEAVFAMYDGGTIQVARIDSTYLRDALANAFSSRVDEGGAEDGVAAQFLACVPGFTEETRVIQLMVDQLPREPDDLALAVQAAVRDNAVFEEQPIFPEAASDPSQTWDISSTPTGLMTITSAARSSLDDVANRIASDALSIDAAAQSGDEELYLDFKCETLVRAVLRSFLHSASEDEHSTDPRLVSAMVLFTSRGASVGLWSPKRGLIIEDAEPFTTPELAFDEEFVSNSIEHALENLLLRLSPTSLESYGFAGVHRVWWVASPSLCSQVHTQMALFESDYYSRYTGGESANRMTRRIGQSLEEMAATGLLLAGDEAASKLLPPINLANGVLDRADDIKTERDEQTAIDSATTRRKVKVAAFAPLILAFGLVIGGYVSTIISSYMLDNTLAVETAEKERLAPVAERRRAATESLKWVNTYLGQVSELRRRQPASLSLLAALDERYPVAEDNTFTVKVLQAQSDGSIVIQGLTKRDDAISALLTKLEYSPTDSSGRKLFERPVMELRKPQVGGINLPNLPAGEAGSAAISTVQSTRSDVTAWTVRAIYTPLQRESVLSPSQAKQAPPAAGTPAGPTNAPNAPPMPPMPAPPSPK